MRIITTIVATVVAFALLLMSVYYVPIGWALIAALLIMATLIISKQKNIALGVVLAMFLFGLVLPFKHNIYHISHNIVIKDNRVVDLDTNKTYAIKAELFKKISLPKNSQKYIACQHAKLFGRMLADRFCYLIIGDEIYELSYQGN